MSQGSKKDYYIKRKDKMMKNFDERIEYSRDIFKRAFSDEKINEMFSQMRAEYEKLIPEIPYIGGQKNPFTSLLIGSISILAMIRVLEKMGFTYMEIGELYYEYRDKLNELRKESIEKTGKDPANYPFEPEYVEFAKKLCESSQKKLYQDDWIADFVESDGKNFEWGFNFYQCGIHNVFKRLGVEKYTRFACIADFSEANMLGFGFTRTQTLGNGADICDHRYVKNYQTPKGWPPGDLEEFKMDY